MLSKREVEGFDADVSGGVFDPVEPLCAALTEVMDVLAWAEWAELEYGPTGALGPACPECAGLKPLGQESYGHEADCHLGVLLAAWRK